MTARRSGNRGIYGISLLLGIFAIAELVFLLLPKLRPLTEVFDLIELIMGSINPSLKGTISGSPDLQAAITVALVWLAAWAALEAFSRSTDELSLWRNISSDSCGRVQVGIRRFACTSSKWALTISTAPLLIVWAILQRMRHGHQMVTVAFVTIDPAIIVKYIKHMLLGVAVLISAIIFFSSGIRQ